MSIDFIGGLVVAGIAIIVYKNYERIVRFLEEFFGVGFLSKSVAKRSAPVDEPEPAIELQPPDFGNIRPVWGEEKDPIDFGPDIHEFPEMGTPKTRFEDFNRRLFILHEAIETTGIWPDTTSDDFATRIVEMTASDALDEARMRLRPRYPVIYDTFGHFAWASRELEQNPDFTDDIVDVYLSYPEDRRPVVISNTSGTKSGSLMFLRYGFEDFSLDMYAMRFHQNACLRLVFDAVLGPRDGWLWFSVARMRQTAIRAFQRTEAQRRQNEATQYIEQQTIAAKRANEHKNRFMALWQHRLEFEADRAGPALQAPNPDKKPEAAQ